MGSRSYGAGNIKRRRGKGSRGGVGRAGLGKHRWFTKLMTEGAKAPKGFFNVTRKVVKTMGLEAIGRGIESGKHPKDAQGFAAVDAKGFKVLGGGQFPFKAKVTAQAFSAKAQKKIEAAGGQAVRTQ